jgi:uncharacterized repeat protein (TIGR03803 family)
MKKIYILLFICLLCSSLAQAQGIYQMWGMTSDGGDFANLSFGGGTIFTLNSEGGNFQTRHSFNRPNGSRPGRTSFSQYNGKLYGLTNYGGSNISGGTIFEWDLATNTYSKKIDLNNANGSVPNGNLVLYLGKFYGMTQYGGINGSGVIFEWDPLTNIYTKKIDLSALNGQYPQGNLTLVAGKFYGLTTSGGINDLGVLFQWDPITNIYTKKLDFNGSNGNEPHGSLILNGTKLYGMTERGGTSNYGVIFEYDAINNLYIKKHDFNGTNGGFPQNSLIINSGTSFYGLTAYGGVSGGGVIFEWNSSTNIYTKKIDLENGVGTVSHGNLMYSNGKYYTTASYGGSIDSGTVFQWNPISNIVTRKVDFSGYLTSTKGKAPYSTLISVNAPIAKGTLNSCTNFPSITIDNTNNNVWVPIVDNLGDAVAEIKANGNNLGVVNTSIYINSGPVREDAAHKLYLDRNLTITPTVQPTTPVNVRLYLKGSEFEALKNATNSMGQPSGINSINDVGFFKNNEGCLPALQNATSPVVVTADAWNGDYVLTATINGFSSFYAANKASIVLSSSLLEFNARLINDNNDAQINWKTTNEINTNSFEIERSVDGRIFTKVGSVSANNTSGEHNYTFKDEGISKLNTQKIYYRLKQNDNDGKFAYSQIVVLNLSKNKNIIIYPNPASETITLTLSNTILLHTAASLIDIQGREVKKFMINNYQEKIDIGNLPTGIYVIKLADGTVGKLFKN